MPNQIKVSEVVEHVEADSDEVEEVLEYLVKQGWLNARHVLLDGYTVND